MFIDLAIFYGVYAKRKIASSNLINQTILEEVIFTFDRV